MAPPHKTEGVGAGLKQDREISRRLYYTWTPFFSQFKSLTEVQRKAILPILEGRDALVCSPTASGKTEAVCAPLLERNYLSVSPWKILYISPTRALINDLYFRLINPVEQLGFKISRHTGDYHQNLEAAKVVLTTPESFDSILCRGKTNRGHVLMDVNALVFDELHFLVGTPRGEHLRWLIHRLLLLKSHAVKKAWISDGSLQRVALSATIIKPRKDHRGLFRSGQCALCGRRRGQADRRGLPGRIEPDHRRVVDQPPQDLKEAGEGSGILQCAKAGGFPLGQTETVVRCSRVHRCRPPRQLEQIAAGRRPRKPSRPKRGLSCLRPPPSRSASTSGTSTWLSWTGRHRTFHHSCRG